jgi:hypothetical protein
MLTRRRYLSAKLAAGALALSAPLGRAALPGVVEETALIYLTPLKSDGGESRCQAEVWFVPDGNELLVVTAADAWRAEAVRRGLTEARIWIGDVGVWDSEARYRALPEVMATARLDDDPAAHAAALDKFGSKYRLEWVLWGPRFRKGLADGSRVLLRYRVS